MVCFYFVQIVLSVLCAALPKGPWDVAGRVFSVSQGGGSDSGKIQAAEMTLCQCVYYNSPV